ncbi:cytochrome [Rhizobium rhizosphaerae]|uniref:Cytochrome n=1 Tax=Xaviernesmea rhizosphaerae TaxID=1672749 RepID=A0A1Q9AKN3_9HYPH|nr:cytochrome P450 [Xaviernesmea rhizosphaerae]OLP55877.1 cytochrome [Xaviernesmea rhizosphaerae]
MPFDPPFRLAADHPSVSLDLHDPRFFTDPWASYAALHAQAPRFFWEEEGKWFFASYADVNALLRDRRFGRQILHVASRQELGLPEPQPHLADFDRIESFSLLELEPPAHTRLRTLVNRAFVSRQIDRLTPRITALSHALIDGFADKGETELLTSYAEVIPVTIIAEMLGVPQEAAPRLLDWSHRMVRMYMARPTRETEDDANQASADFGAYLADIIDWKRKNPADDLLTQMITADRDGQTLSEEELISTAALLLNAGHEATVHQIGNAVALILSQGADPAALFADDRATTLTVEECLRRAAPLHLFQRIALEDVTLDGGITIKRGERIGLLLGAANVDPTRFTDPMAFRPTRDEGANLSFGAGIHFCIGAPLARLELKISLPILFQHLPNLRLKAMPEVKDSFHFHGLERVELVW